MSEPDRNKDDEENVLNDLIQRVLTTYQEAIALLDHVKAKMDETHAQIAGGQTHV